MKNKISIKDAAQFLGITVTDIIEMMKTHTIRNKREAGVVKVFMADLLDWQDYIRYLNSVAF